MKLYLLNFWWLTLRSLILNSISFCTILFKVQIPEMSVTILPLGLMQYIAYDCIINSVCLCHQHPYTKYKETIVVIIWHGCVVKKLTLKPCDFKFTPTVQLHRWVSSIINYLEAHHVYACLSPPPIDNCYWFVYFPLVW